MKQIALDGPSGAGKSTVAKMVASELGFIYLDTGAMYRALGLYLIEHNIALDDVNAIAKVLDKIDIAFDVTKVLLNGKDVTQTIRHEEVSQAASKIATHAVVRSHMVALQKKMAEGGNVVMEGRDICSVVLPKAQHKYFITADPKIRAKRRYDEQIARGLDVNYDDILSDVIARDARDTTRAVVPLVKAEDAELIDTSNMTINEIVNYIKAQVSCG